MSELETGTWVYFDIGDGRRRQGYVHHLRGDDVVIREQDEPGGTVVMPRDRVVSVEDEPHVSE